MVNVMFLESIRILPLSKKLENMLVNTLKVRVTISFTTIFPEPSGAARLVVPNPNVRASIIHTGARCQGKPCMKRLTLSHSFHS